MSTLLDCVLTFPALPLHICPYAAAANPICRPRRPLAKSLRLVTPPCRAAPYELAHGLSKVLYTMACYIHRLHWNCQFDFPFDVSSAYTLTMMPIIHAPRPQTFTTPPNSQDTALTAFPFYVRLGEPAA